MEDSALDDFQSDMHKLAQELASAFETNDVRFHYNAENESLFIELGGLENKSDEEIELLAEPILNDFDLDIDEILLLPFKKI